MNAEDLHVLFRKQLWTKCAHPWSPWALVNCNKAHSVNSGKWPVWRPATEHIAAGKVPARRTATKHTASNKVPVWRTVKKHSCLNPQLHTILLYYIYNEFQPIAVQAVEWPVSEGLYVIIYNYMQPLSWLCRISICLECHSWIESKEMLESKQKWRKSSHNNNLHSQELFWKLLMLCFPFYCTLHGCLPVLPTKK